VDEKNRERAWAHFYITGVGCSKKWSNNISRRAPVNRIRFIRIDDLDERQDFLRNATNSLQQVLNTRMQRCSARNTENRMNILISYYFTKKKSDKIFFNMYVW